MSIALRAGLTGILTSQRAMNVVGQNIANANTPSYARRVITLKSLESGSRLKPAGGVEVAQISRITDRLLEQRMYTQGAGLGEAQTTASYLSQIETILQEPGDNGLNSALTRFFQSLQDLAAEPESPAVRSGVVQEAINLCDTIRYIRDEMSAVLQTTLEDVRKTVDHINTLTAAIFTSNQDIATALTAGGSALGLQDSRQELINQLSSEFGIRVAYDPTLDSATITGGGTMLVAKGGSLPLTAPTNIDGTVSAGNGGDLQVSSGRLRALLSLMHDTVPKYLESLDELASTLIREVNKIHAQGVGLTGPFSSVEAENVASDSTGAGDGSNVPLSDAGLPFAPTAGNLVINVHETASGATSAYTVAVNPDTMTLADLAAALDSLAGVNASATGGRLSIQAAPGYTFDFVADQGTDVLAALGVNSLFTGSDASSLGVSPWVSDHLDNVAAGRTTSAGDGANAAQMLALKSQPLLESGTTTLQEAYQSLVTEIGSDSALAQKNEQAHNALVTALSDQRESISGVSLDEEAVRLLEFQQMFAACSRYVGVVNSLLEKLLNYLG